MEENIIKTRSVEKDSVVVVRGFSVGEEMKKGG